MPFGESKMLLSESKSPFGENKSKMLFRESRMPFGKSKSQMPFSKSKTIAITVEYGCVSLRMRFFSQNFGTIKRILPGSSSPSHREGPGTEVGADPISFPEPTILLSRIAGSGNEIGADRADSSPGPPHEISQNG